MREGGWAWAMPLCVTATRLTKPSKQVERSTAYPHIPYTRRFRVASGASMKRLLLLLLACAACGHRPWDAPGERWVRVETPHFTVLTDTDRDDHTPVLERLEDVHAALAATFFQ